MTRAERLAHVELKVERAKTHVKYLKRGIRQFLKTKPYKVSTYRNPQTRQLVYYLRSVDRVPVSIALIAGDAIQNLMSALDHLAYQIVGSDTADKHPAPDWIYFPIGHDAADFETRAKGKMKGANSASIDAIRTFNPYKGGNDLLWILYRLNNIEKHRLLITVGSMFDSFDIGAHVSSMMQKAFPDMEIPLMSAFFKPAVALFPLKAGDELFIDAIDAEINKNLQFGFNVALNEPGVIEGKPVLETLDEFVGLVERIVMALTPRLR